jgi:hypothetical protein
VWEKEGTTITAATVASTCKVAVDVTTAITTIGIIDRRDVIHNSNNNGPTLIMTTMIGHLPTPIKGAMMINIDTTATIIARGQCHCNTTTIMGTTSGASNN